LKFEFLQREDLISDNQLHRRRTASLEQAAYSAVGNRLSTSTSMIGLLDCGVGSTFGVCCLLFMAAPVCQLRTTSTAQQAGVPCSLAILSVSSPSQESESACARSITHTHSSLPLLDLTPLASLHARLIRQAHQLRLYTHST
jgi:hypothetical protein